MSYPNDAPAAAWYPDPQTPGQVRWWDGTNWTEHVSVPAPAAVPENAAPVSAVEHAEPAYIGRHAAGAQPAPRQEPTAPRIRPRVRVELAVEEPVLEYVYA
jgi:predicted RNase H-like nuclease